MLAKNEQKISHLVQGYGFEVTITCQPVIACTKLQLVLSLACLFRKIFQVLFDCLHHMNEMILFKS
jgi:hypothetical protein